MVCFPRRILMGKSFPSLEHAPTELHCRAVTVSVQVRTDRQAAHSTAPALQQDLHGSVTIPSEQKNAIGSKALEQREHIDPDGVGVL